MALKWIHENAEYFNGDRDSITLFGPDAGSASAGLLMVAPDTRNIVSKVIAQVCSVFCIKSFKYYFSFPIHLSFFNRNFKKSI